MNKKPLISILMPVKNTAVYLKECLDSILQQTETNWELLAINDHSTDSSYSILQDYANEDYRIKTYTNTGNGIIDALRLAYSKSQGTLITRMDSDDKMIPEKLAVLSNNLLERGVGHVAVGKVRYFSENSLGEGFKNYEAWLNGLIETGTNFKEIYKECVIPSPCWMVYRNDLDLCEAFIPNDYPEDYDLTFRFFKYGLLPIACSQILHLWRDYPIRTSRTHEHYVDQTFLNIKFRYFLKLDYNPNKNLVIWGAGTKGKTIAKKLQEKGIHFFWICDNPNKIGKYIYDQEMLPFTYLEKITNPQSIITVANKNSQLEIRNYLKNKSFISGKDYFFFC